MLCNLNTCRPDLGPGRFELHQLLRLSHETRQQEQGHLFCYVIAGSPSCLEHLQGLAGIAAPVLAASVSCQVSACIPPKFFAYAQGSVRRQRRAI